MIQSKMLVGSGGNAGQQRFYVMILSSSLYGLCEENENEAGGESIGYYRANRALGRPVGRDPQMAAGGGWLFDLSLLMCVSQKNEC